VKYFARLLPEALTNELFCQSFDHATAYSHASFMVLKACTNVIFPFSIFSTLKLFILFVPFRDLGFNCYLFLISGAKFGNKNNICKKKAIKKQEKYKIICFFLLLLSLSIEIAIRTDCKNP